MNPENFELMASNLDFFQDCAFIQSGEFEDCNDIPEDFVENDYRLTVGEKALLFLFPHPRLFENFW